MQNNRRSIPARLLLCLAITLLSVPISQAQQLLDARDGVTIEALISQKEPTRIRIDNAPIISVFGNIYSSNCATQTSNKTTAIAATTPSINPAGEVVVECDANKGEIFIRPVKTNTKPINLFIASANATYTLLLRPTDTPADTIVIRDQTPSRSGVLPRQTSDMPSGRSANPIRQMKALLVMMATDRIPSDIQVEEVNQLIPLWQEARLTLLRRFTGRGLIGERYQLDNISGNTMVLSEQELDRANGHVLGIALENHNLRPNDSTNVFVIRMEEAP